MEILKVYTDGACSGNPGPGGFAAIIINEKNEEKVVSGGEKTTTNNRMELLSFIESCRYIISNYDTQMIQIEMNVDSQYLMKGVTEWLQGWKKKNWKGSAGPVKNRDLWEMIDEIVSKVKIKWIWVKGHNGNKYNEIVDKIAVEESNKHK